MQLSRIIQTGKLLDFPEFTHAIQQLGRPIVASVAKNCMQNYKNDMIKNGTEFDVNELIKIILAKFAERQKQLTQPVINGTGILIHTNLGRSPINQNIWKKAGQTVCRYSNLEFNLEDGKRGDRLGGLKELIQNCFGGEDATVVNNNAAAIHLILKTFAVGKEVIVSRGEQVQIGGGFRIPDILAESGAILKDVGTTNITTIDDYLDAINDNTAMVLLVHQSNYYIEGFTEQVDPKILRKKLPSDVMLVIDQGSGNQSVHLKNENLVSYYTNLGADIVSFSGDKMLGGPQAGIIVGRSQYLTKIKKHPLMRVFRSSKETYALLEHLFIERLNHPHSVANRTEWVLQQPLKWHKDRAEKIAKAVGQSVHIIESLFLIGGGTTPKTTYSTYALKICSQHSANDLLNYLRSLSTPIIGIIKNNELLLYPVTFLDGEEDYVIQSLIDIKGL